MTLKRVLLYVRSYHKESFVSRDSPAVELKDSERGQIHVYSS